MSQFDWMMFLLCFPVSWAFGWTMALRWTKLKYLVTLEALSAQVTELKEIVQLLKAQTPKKGKTKKPAR